MGHNAVLVPGSFVSSSMAFDLASLETFFYPLGGSLIQDQLSIIFFKLWN